MKITKEDFESFENVRKSGAIDVFSIKGVSELTGLERNKIFEILKFYDDLKQEYGEKNE